MTKIKTRLAQMAVAAILATGLLVVAQIDSADATFSGKGVHNPTAETETFVSERDGDSRSTQ